MKINVRWNFDIEFQSALIEIFGNENLLADEDVYNLVEFLMER